MKDIFKEFNSTVESVETAVKMTDGVMDPIRRSAFRRFPTLFALLVGFGAGATFFGVERFIMEIEWLNERPWLILLVGLMTLALTGRLHKKLE